MTIDEVIKLLTMIQDGKITPPFDDINRAINLGIEALKRVRDVESQYRSFQHWLLPGETEELTPPNPLTFGKTKGV